MGLIDALNSFREAVAGILPPGHVVSDAPALAEYTGSSFYPGACSPQLVVFPGTKEDVKTIVAQANAYNVALVPVSSGLLPSRIDAVTVENGVIVNFKKMSRVHKIDEVNRCVMLEPGVTFGELIPEVRKQGLRLNKPFLPHPSKSVVTSCLEREPVLIPKYQYDYMDPLLNVEVVYGTGDEFRTGSASGPGDLDFLKADKVNPWGPGTVDFLRFVSGAQGTMGLVIWGMVKAEILPALQELYFVCSPDAAALTSLAGSLLRKRVPDECLVLNNIHLASVLSADSESDFTALKNSLPAWTLMVCTAGYRRRPEERLAIQRHQMFSLCNEAGLRPSTVLPGAEGRADGLLEMLAGCWQGTSNWKAGPGKTSRDVFFLTPLSRVGEYITLVKDLARRYDFPAENMGCYVQPLVQGRGCHCEFTFSCDAFDTGGLNLVNTLFSAASDMLMKNGAFFSRPYGEWADRIYDPEAQETIALKQIKSVFDPNNILNPGKLCFPAGEKWTS